MSNFKPKNYEKNSELFDLATEFHILLKNVSDVFNKRHFRLSTLPRHKTIFLYLYNMAQKSYSSIHLLCLEGYGQDSSVVLRSMLENLITAKYILYDIKLADKKAERFEEYRWVEMKRYLEYWKIKGVPRRQDLQKQVLSKEKEVIQKVDDFKKKFSITNRNKLATWSGISVRDMAEEVSMLEDYVLTYRLCCSFSHTSFIGTTAEVRKTAEGINFSSNPSFRGVIEDMKSAITFIAEFLRIYNGVFSLGVETELGKVYDKGLAIFEMAKYREGLDLRQ